ncbi:MAG: DMT family transporter [Bacteroidales bacterium]|nr:DMT family transporter [Bacteroidales bacterium]
MSKSKSGVYFLVILAMIFWGFTFVVFKFAYQSFRPISIVFFRLLVSIVFLFGFALLFKRLNRIRRKDQLWFLLLALAEPFFYFLGEAYGLTLVSATIGAVIISTIPLVVPFAAYYLYREKLTLMNYLGLLLSFVGVLMVVLTRSEGLAADWKGILLMFVAVISAVAYTMVVKSLADDYTPITITAYQSLYGLLMFLPLFLILELPHLELARATNSSLLAVGFLGVFGSGICFILITIGIRELGAARANIFGNLIPVVTAIVSFFLLKESMPLLKVLGILIVILGLFLSQISSLRVKRNTGRESVRHIPNA